MTNSQKLQAAFNGMIGFFQFYDPSYTGITSDLTTSSTGLYLQGIHPLCTLENIYNSSPEFSKYQYPLYDASLSYSVGNIVKQNKVYIALEAIAAGQLPEVSNKWAEYNPLSTWLKNIYTASILEMFGDLIRYKKLELNPSKALIDSLKLYDGVGSIADRIIKRGRFVGLELKTNNQEGLAVAISQIGLQLDQPQDLTLYLYHSSQPDPIKQITVTIDKALSFKWTEVSDLILDYSSTLYDTDGVFYLGYYESDLTGQAIQRKTEWNKAPCYGCSGWNYQSYQTWSKHISIKAFYVPSSYISNDKTLWLDGSKISYDPDNNWGFNLSITVSCNLTDFYISNKSFIATCFGMKLALKFIKEIAFTTRINGIAEKTKALAMMELSNKDPDSFFNQYIKELKAVSVDFSGMSSDCMPSSKRQGITYNAI